MADSHSARGRRSLPSIVGAAISVVGTFLVILVGLLTTDKHPALGAWVAGAAAAVAAGVLTFLQATGADREIKNLVQQVKSSDREIKDLVQQVKVLQRPSVELLEPSDGSGTQVPEIKIRGRVLIQGFPDNAVGSILKERGLKIVPFVKPMTTSYEPAARWYAQNVASIDEADGEVLGSVRIGTLQSSSGEEFRIILTILPKGLVPKTNTTFDEMPIPGFVAVSDVSTVFRID
jgi:hypothetical protein